jgi:DNA replication protein DnaC
MSKAYDRKDWEALRYKIHRMKRADNSSEKLFKKLLACDLLIIDDFDLKPLTRLEAEDIYELITGRYLKKSIIVTSNRKIEAWVELFPDLVVANAALGPSFRQFYRTSLLRLLKEIIGL